MSPSFPSGGEAPPQWLGVCMQVLHMMLGLERADRTRIFSEELVDERGVRSMQSAMASRARPPPRDLRSGPSSVHSDDQRRLPPVHPRPSPTAAPTAHDITQLQTFSFHDAVTLSQFLQ